MARDIASVVAGLAFSDEVTPSLDLRGLSFESGVHLQSIDLFGARLDFATLNGHIADCRMIAAVFDGLKATKVIMGTDFRNASFVKASLKDCYLGQSTLDGANFTEAKLQCARFKGSSCRGATFARANLKMAECPFVDFQGADLSGADLTGATLGSVKFDTGTKLLGTVLTAAAMNDEFREFANCAGAIIDKDDGVSSLAMLDATTAMLEKQNVDGRLTRVLCNLPRIRELVRQEPAHDWLAELMEGVTPDIASEIEEAYLGATKCVSDYLV
jgi:uncharacterized protein YjbI with pentapeptide repeats